MGASVFLTALIAAMWNLDLGSIGLRSQREPLFLCPWTVYLRNNDNPVTEHDRTLLHSTRFSHTPIISFANWSPFADTSSNK